MRYLVLLLTVSSLSACSIFDLGDDSSSLPFRTINEDPPPRLHVGTIVVRDTAAWNQAWQQYYDEHPPADSSTQIPSPPVDFRTQMIAAVFWPQTSGCRSAVEAIDSVWRTGETTTLHVGPLPDLGPCRAYMQPFQAITFDQADGPVRFKGLVPETE